MSALQGYEQNPLVSFEESLRPLLSIVPGIEQMIQLILAKLNFTNDDRSIDEAASIMLYILKWKRPESSFQFFLNQTLRSRNREALLLWFPYIRLFISALSKLPSIFSPTVYHAMRMNETEEYTKEQPFTWWSFVSCRSSIEHAYDSFHDEPRAIFIISCDLAKDISEYSFDGNSEEILLYPERQFRVIASFHHGEQLKFIQIREIRATSPRIQIPQTTSDRQYGTSRLESVIDQSADYPKLDLNNHQLTDADMPVIVAYAIVKKQYQQLLLSENKITSKGALTLANALDQNTSLTYLSLSYNDLSDTGVKHLANILARNNSKLTMLSLHETGITDQSVPYLANMLKTNTTLTWLYLGRNRISDQSMHYLTDALTQQTTTLKALDLSHNQLITDASMNYLIEMLESNTSLETLWIHNCGISIGEKQKLKSIAQIRRRFFLLFVDDISADILKISKDLKANRRTLPILLRLVR